MTADRQCKVCQEHHVKERMIWCKACCFSVHYQCVGISDPTDAWIKASTFVCPPCIRQAVANYATSNSEPCDEEASVDETEGAAKVEYQVQRRLIDAIERRISALGFNETASSHKPQPTPRSHIIASVPSLNQKGARPKEVPPRGAPYKEALSTEAPPKKALGEKYPTRPVPAPRSSSRPAAAKRKFSENVDTPVRGQPRDYQYQSPL